MATGTNNPVGSTDPRDLLANAENLDAAVNDMSARTWTDRLGRERVTMSAVESAVPDALEARDSAERARDSALAGANLYATEPDGRAAVADGETFNVEGSGDAAAYIYRRIDANSSVLIGSLPSTDSVRSANSKASTAEERMPSRNFGTWPYAIVGDDHVPIIGVKPSGFAKVVTDELPGRDLLDPRYRYAITDPATNDLVYGFRWDGAFVQGPARILDSEFSHVWGDEDGNVWFARRWDGSFAPGGIRGRARVYTEGEAGKRSIWAHIDGFPYQLTSSGDCWGPEIAASSVNYLTRQGGVIQASVQAGDKYAPFVVRMMHILGLGQSLSVGPGDLISTAPTAANRLFTARIGVRGLNTATPLQESDIVPFAPLSAVYSEPPVVSEANSLALTNTAPADAALFVTLHGSGGKTIADLSKGTPYYNNSIVAVAAVNTQCAADGLGYSVGFLDWIQGEADRAAAPGAYFTELQQLQADYLADIAAITGQTSLPMLLDQISNWTAYNRAESNVPLEQLQLALNYPEKFVCAGPKYWLQTNQDGVHINGPRSVSLGCMHAQAAAAVLAGAAWLPTHCTSAVRTGREIKLKFHTPEGPLVADVGRISDPGNLGIRWIDDTESAAVQSVTVHADNTVTVQLTADPTGTNPQIGIADIGISGAGGGPLTGPRSCLRDSSTLRDIAGQPIFNWACHQRIAVTV